MKDIEVNLQSLDYDNLYDLISGVFGGSALTSVKGIGLLESSM